MSTKKAQEKTPGTGNTPENPSTEKPPEGIKDPLAEAAKKLEAMGESPSMVGDLKPEGVTVRDLSEKTDPLASFAEKGLTAQAAADAIIKRTPGDPDPPVAPEDIDSLPAWLLTVVGAAAAKIIPHREYFLSKEKQVNGKVANPFGPAQKSLVRFYNNFSSMAGDRGLKSE